MWMRRNLLNKKLKTNQKNAVWVRASASGFEKFFYVCFVLAFFYSTVNSN